MTVEVREIRSADLPRVADFLAAEIEPAVAAEQWREATDVPWPFPQPNHGFMLSDEDRVVGVYLAYYSERPARGGPARYCNLGSWSVLATHRVHSIRLLQALLGQRGYVFTDFTPDRTVIAINRRLGFAWLAGRAAAIPCLPWPPAPRSRRRITSDPDEIGRDLSGRDLRHHQDHLGVERLRAVLIADEERHCLLLFRLQRRFGLPVALLLHSSGPELLGRSWAALGHHMLVRHRVAAILVEERISGSLPRLRLPVGAPNRMIRGADPAEAEIDYLYSELTRLSW